MVDMEVWLVNDCKLIFF